jgi:hypothetical protein
LIGLHESGAAIPADPLTVPLERLVAPLGPVGYLATAQQVGLMRPLPGLRSQEGRLPDFEDRETVKDLAVTPLHLARVMAGLALEGQLPDPRLSLMIEPNQNYSFDAETAAAVRALLSQVDAQIIGLTGQASPEETGQTSLSWFVGLAPAVAVPPPDADQTSLALGEQGLILDPTKIEATTATPTPTPPLADTARYAIAVVVVTDTPKGDPAAQIAKAPLRVLLRLQ